MNSRDHNREPAAAGRSSITQEVRAARNEIDSPPKNRHRVKADAGGKLIDGRHRSRCPRPMLLDGSGSARVELCHQFPQLGVDLVSSRQRRRTNATTGRQMRSNRATRFNRDTGA